MTAKCQGLVSFPQRGGGGGAPSEHLAIYIPGMVISSISHKKCQILENTE